MSQLSRIPGVRSNLGLAARAPGWRGGPIAQAVASGARSPEIRGLRSPHLHRFPSQKHSEQKQRAKRSLRSYP